MSESFASATQTDPWNLERVSLDLKESATPIFAGTGDALNKRTGDESLRKSPKAGTLGGLQQSKLNKLINCSRSPVSMASHATEDVHLCNLTSSEDDYQKNSKEGHAAHGKRRRISPDPVEKDCKSVYDDSTLQKHVAAESQRSLSQCPPYSGDAGLGNELASRVIPKRRSQGPCEEPHEPFRSQNTRKQKASGCLANTRRKTFDELKTEPSAQDRASIPRRLAQRVNQSALGITAKPTTPEKRLPTTLMKKAGDRTEGKSLPNGDSCPLVTPPRSLRNTKRNTTPRQQELWDKLLVGGISNGSPSSLDLPGLELTDRGVRNVGEEASQLTMASNTITHHAMKSRRSRIVDTLHAHDDDLRHENICMNERPTSISTDEFSESEETEASDLNSAITVQTLPSTDSQKKPRLLDVRVSSNVSHTEPTSIAAGPKVTYARQRSYLTDADLDGVAMLNVPDTVEPLNLDESRYRAIGERIPKYQFKQTLQDQNWDSERPSSGALRSIHELREAGGNIRLIGELEAILEDIEEQQISSCTLRRMRLLDLVKKLQEPSNSRLLIEQGLESRLLAFVGVDTDIITNSLHAAAILQLISCPSSTSVLPQLRDARIIDFLIDLLGMDYNLAAQAKQRDVNVSKYAQHEYSTMCCSVLESTIWRAGSPPFLSCHVLALQCLEHIVRQTRESGSLSQVLSTYAIRRIVATSVPSPWMPALQCTNMTSIQLELAVSILESCTISNAAECHESLWEGETLERIVGLLPLLCSWEEEKCGTSRTLTLRLYVNLTNNNPSLCEELSTPEIVEVMCEMITVYFEQSSSHAARHQPPMNLDNLILTLGALINLAESSDVVRQLVPKLYRDNRSYLAVLLELFRTRSQSAAEVSPPLPQYSGSADYSRSTRRRRRILTWLLDIWPCCLASYASVGKSELGSVMSSNRVA